MLSIRTVLVIAAAAFGSAAPTLAQASDGITTPEVHPVILEIFVSRNCPNCPKAHKNLAEMATEGQDFVQLTWSVDYWDHRGEPDEMATEQAKIRQKEYITQMGLRAPYTPQAVFNGASETPASRKTKMKISLAAAQTEPGAEGMSMKTEGTQLLLNAPALPTSHIYLLQIASVRSHGVWLENAVLAMEDLGEWSGGALELAIRCPARCIALVQEPSSGPIHGALMITSAASGP